MTINRATAEAAEEVDNEADDQDQSQSPAAVSWTAHVKAAATKEQKQDDDQQKWVHISMVRHFARGSARLRDGKAHKKGLPRIGEALSIELKDQLYCVGVRSRLGLALAGAAGGAFCMNFGTSPSRVDHHRLVLFLHVAAQDRLGQGIFQVVLHRAAEQAARRTSSS